MSYRNDIILSRQKQINTLRVFNENVSEVVPGKEYSISFSSSGLVLSLKIKLPDGFPNDKPTIEISPLVYHPWVDSTGKVDSPGLRSFSQHSDLGMVVLALRSELEKSNLKLIPTCSPTTTVVASPPAAVSGTAVCSSAEAMHTKKEFTSPTSLIQDPIRAKLSELSVETLKDILADEDHFEKVVFEIENDLPSLGNLSESSENMRDDLKVKALENQKLQSHIEESRNQLICKYEDLHMKKASLQASVDHLHKLSARVEPNLLAEKLISLSMTRDEESEEIAESFLQTNIQVEQFLSKYIKSRGEGYMQKIKADKVKRLNR